MKRYLYGLAIFLLVFCVTGVGWTKDASMPASPVPELIQLVGTTAVAIAPTRYPVFSAQTSDNPVCDEYLKAAFDNDEDPSDAVAANCPYPGLNCATKGLSLAPLWYKSKYSGTMTAAPLAGQPAFALIPGLKTTVTIPEKYRTTAKVLFTWTVRIEGSGPGVILIRPELCSSWNGTTEQFYEKGTVYTQLYVDGKAMGNKALMTIPASGTSSTTQVTPPSDPTHTGSYLLTKDDFDGALPAEFTVEVRWYNDTSMNITSPANMRNLIATLIPVNEG